VVHRSDDNGGTTNKSGFVGNLLVAVTRPGYKTLSLSFSNKMPFSPRGVTADGMGAEGGRCSTEKCALGWVARCCPQVVCHQATPDGQGVELERVDTSATIDSKEKDHKTNDLGLQDLL
jgi:hypothetical protein